MGREVFDSFAGFDDFLVYLAVSLVLLSMPPLLTSLFLLFVAARTGWLPISGMRSATVPPEGAISTAMARASASTPALAAADAGKLGRPRA